MVVILAPYRVQDKLQQESRESFFQEVPEERKELDSCSPIETFEDKFHRNDKLLLDLRQNFRNSNRWVYGRQ